MKVGFVYDAVYLKHDTGEHVENPRRLQAIMSRLEESGLKQRLVSLAPRPATTDELMLVHDEQHIAHIQEVAQRGGGWLDLDTVMSADSYEAALYAAGGSITAVEAVMNGDVDSAFALVRPPGHHATPGRAMGFCLFNNVAIATRYALDKYGPERAAIVDFDVHHGNGTQDAFYSEPRVLYISTHQYPHYPGTGSMTETGAGDAAGTTLNVPLPAGCGDREYLQVFEQVIIPAVRRFSPQLILVSAGYDTHWADQLAMMQVTTTGFALLVRAIKELADKLCHGRLTFNLEGGYNLAALAASVKATFDVLMGDTDIEDPLGQPQRRFQAPDLARLISSIKRIHHLG
ncbi:MAG: histone deacetylase [Chloroflexi bacterium]|nr:histone deacetylase [Chloroflexota bacterium]